MSSKIIEYKKREDFANTMLAKYFKLAPNTIISDIGAGFGFMRKNIESIGGIWQPFDYYKKIEESTIWDLNNSYPKECKKAGTVIFMEVMEHLSNPFLGIQNISEHMETGAILILTVPNPQSVQSRISLLLKGVLYSFQPKHIKEHHVFTPWKHIVEFFLTSSGLEIIEYAVVDTQYRNEKPTSIKSFFLLNLYKFLEWKYPESAGISYGIVARKINK